MLAVGLGVVAGLTLRTHRRAWRAAGGIARETAIVLGLFALWQRAAELSITRVKGAVGHGKFVWHVERVMHLPSELTMQRAALPHPSVVKVSNLYYAGLHFPVTIVFLIWLYARHRARYPLVRNTMAIATGACLLGQMIPVAPPRLVPSLGLVDTGLQYGQSVYGSLGRGLADQLSAMPSVHVAWAVLVGIVVVAVGTSRWRWLALLHPLATMFVVVVTANHFWLDGIVAMALLGMAHGIAAFAPTVVGSLGWGSRTRTSQPGPLRPIGVQPVGIAAEYAERPCA
jgi:hypothetical protein